MSKENNNAESGKKRDRRGGRPREVNPRIHTIGTRLTAEEFAYVMHQIRSSNLQRSEAVRLLLLNSSLPEKIFGGVDPSASKAYQELAPMQSNLNQIASWLNKTKPVGIPLEALRTIHDRMAKLEVLLRVIRKEMLTRAPQ